MRNFLAIITVILLTGCANLIQWDQTKIGYRPEDPCIRCGEKWDQIPPQEFDAQIKRANGVQW